MSIPSFEYVLPVIRGIQAGREYYISMCPVRYIPKLLAHPDEEVPPEMRARRSHDKTRIPQIARYILDNPKNYIFSAITASIDAKITFEPIGAEAEGRKIGRLRVPMDARFAIHDGQQRKAALELALRENPDLAYETVALILFLDIGLRHAQQVCLDLNRYSVPLDASLMRLYEHRDERASLVRAVVKEVPVFRMLTDMERSTLSSRSGKLFTLTSVYNATLALLVGWEGVEQKVQVDCAVRYWNAVSASIPDWQQVLQKKVSAGEVRRDFVHWHAIALLALGKVGASLVAIYPEGWEAQLAGLETVDWSRSNPDWQGRILSKGGISQSQTSVSRMVAYIKRCLGLPLTGEEEGLQNTLVEARRQK